MKQFLITLLIPIARFCYRWGVSLPECVDALKAALLLVGREKLETDGEIVTASRLSVMSGVHRKDAARFLKGASTTRATIVAPAIKVLGAWNTKKKYLDKKGKPRMLTVGSEESEFSKLVREIIVDVHPRTVLRELIRLQLVAVSDSGVSARKSSFVSSTADETTAKLISQDIDDLLLSAEENVASTGTPPHHHTATRFDNIPAVYLPELRKWIVTEAGEFHRKIRAHVAQHDRDLSDRVLDDPDQKTAQFTFGSFGMVRLVKIKQDKENSNGD